MIGNSVWLTGWEVLLVILAVAVVEVVVVEVFSFGIVFGLIEVLLVIGLTWSWEVLLLEVDVLLFGIRIWLLIVWLLFDDLVRLLWLLRLVRLLWLLGLLWLLRFVWLFILETLVNVVFDDALTTILDVLVLTILETFDACELLEVLDMVEFKLTFVLIAIFKLILVLMFLLVLLVVVLFVRLLLTFTVALLLETILETMLAVLAIGRTRFVAFI